MPKLSMILKKRSGLSRSNQTWNIKSKPPVKIVMIEIIAASFMRLDHVLKLLKKLLSKIRETFCVYLFPL